MARLMKATMGHKLALGDWRALMCEKTSPWEMEQVEMQAGTRQIPDSLPFTHYATAIGTAMRKRFPVPPGAMHTLTFTYKDGQDITEFLSKSKDTWTDVAGEHPSAGELHTTLFRKALLSALPKSVREVMESNPDLPGANTEHWERHLKYHLKKYLEKQSVEKQGNDLAQGQLVELNLKEARKKLNDVKKNNNNTQMIQQQQPDCFDSQHGGVFSHRHGKDNIGLDKIIRGYF